MDRGAWWAIQSIGWQRVRHKLAIKQQQTTNCTLNFLHIHSCFLQEKKIEERGKDCFISSSLALIYIYFSGFIVLARTFIKIYEYKW